MNAKMNPQQIGGKRDSASTADALRGLFRTTFGGGDADVVVCAPGRVNLIGDHTDYNEGLVMPMTIDRGVYVCLAVRPGASVRLFSANFGERFDYVAADRPAPARASWPSYVVGAVEELRARGLISGGFDLLIFGDVPLGAGLSSSAALTVSVVFGLQTAFAFDLDPIDAIRLSRNVEHRYAGVQCGIMDPYCSRLGREGHALFLDCRSLEHEHVPIRFDHAGLSLVLVDSRVSRGLVDSKYGERREECRQVVRAIRAGGKSVQSLREVNPAWLEDEGIVLDDRLLRRGRFVVEENARVERARNAIRSEDNAAFGDLMNESHGGLRDLFDVSIPEVDTLVSTAQRTEGVLGARMTGGGFGGSVVCLVHTAAIERLRRAIETAYQEKHGRRPGVHVLRENLQTEVL